METADIMAMITLLQRIKNQPKRYAEITMQKVMIMFYIYICYQELENKRNPRLMWVRDIFSEQRRRLQGASDNLIIEMQLSDNLTFFNYLRMSPSMFHKLLQLVGPRIEKQKMIRNPIAARTRLQVTLRWLACGDSMISLSYAYRIAQCTISNIIPDTCEAIWYALKEKVLLVPSEKNWYSVADDFETRCQFPHCIGSINGKHVVIQVYIVYETFMHTCEMSNLIM